MDKFLYWFREDKKRPLKTDLEWALNRFRVKFEIEPEVILVPPETRDDFAELTDLEVRERKYIGKRYLGIATRDVL